MKLKSEMEITLFSVSEAETGAAPKSPKSALSPQNVMSTPGSPGDKVFIHRHKFSSIILNNIFAKFNLIIHRNENMTVGRAPNR